MNRRFNLEYRINTYQQRLEWYRAHNVYGIVNGEPGWIYEEQIEQYECRIEEMEEELDEIESEEALAVLDWEMHRYEQTKFIKRAAGNLVEGLLWLPAVVVIGKYAGYYSLNVLAVVGVLLIARYGWHEIKFFKRRRI